MGDDIPYRLGNGTATLLELPSHYALDDWGHYMFSREFDYKMPIKAPSQALEVFRAEFDAAWRYGGLWISVWHPFLSGRLARFDAVADLMEYMAAKGGVWFATLRDICAHIEGLIAAGQWVPRTDRLPQYPDPIPELAR